MKNDKYNDYEMPVKSRTQKIADAKLAFSDNGADKRNETGPDGNNIFPAIRLIFAGMIFMLLIIAFYNDFSYNGFDKELVIQYLTDEDHWNDVVRQISGYASDILAKIN